jgi:hypothetical protein
MQNSTYMRALLSLCAFLFVTHSYAQTQDLFALAKGDFVSMNALFNENGSLFGYISIYDYGKVSVHHKKFEYVVLDKNLNPFANNVFQGDLTAGAYKGYINFDGKIVLKPSRLDYRFVEEQDLFTPASLVIDLKTNTVKNKLVYDYDHGNFKIQEANDSWTDMRKDQRKEKREKGYNYISYVAEIKEGGYLVHEYDDHLSYEENNSLMRYDENKKEMWSYKYNVNGSKTQSQVISYLDKDENYYYGLLRDRVKRDIKYYLLVLDMKTGKEVHKKEIPDPHELLPYVHRFPTSSYGFLNNDHTFDDKIVMVGRKVSGIFYSGIFRLLIDKKTFAADVKLITYTNDLRPFIPGLNGHGSVGDGYMLDPRDIFFQKDGSVGILFEKMKPGGMRLRTTDMVYVYTDKDFKIKGAKVLEKEKSKWNSDYLFSQNLNNDNDLVFFYRDYQKDDETKDKNWNLFINTMINGEFKQESIPISSKEEYFIYPYIAKEGYIMLQEFNVKGKYNKVRLERLNY